VVWYSSAGGVYASSCGGDVSGETIAITDAYAKASGYPAYDSYDFYATTGDLVNWLAKKNIPAISVLLTTHKDTELAKNKSGLGALLQHYSK
jgi:beta-lactamase superfamily II metal-dependent hydrolase